MVTSSAERRFFSHLIRGVFIVVSIATVASFFSRFHWFAELFSHFRFYYLLVQALLVLIFLHSGRWAFMAATLLLAIPNAFYVTPYLTPFLIQQSVAEGEQSDVDIVALNLNFRNRDYARVRAYFDAVAADMIVAAELTSAWQDELRSLDRMYPYQVGERRPDPWGLMVYSRLPFVEAELLDLGVAGSVHARVVLNTDDGLLQIFAVHLYSPTTPERAAKRNTQLSELARLVNDSDLPTAIVGDLNVTPFSPYFEQLLSSAGVIDARRRDGFHFTWPTSPVPLWIPIDHVLADPTVRVTRVERGPAAGSDHYPLEISIARLGSGTG